MNFTFLKFLIVFLISTFLMSCGGDDSKSGGKGTVNFRFKLLYGNEPLEMFKTYKYPVTNDNFYLTRLSFFLSELKIKSTSREVMLKDIDYLNLTASHTGNTANTGLEYKISDIPSGNYSAVQFGIGVPKASNAKEPKDFSASSILSSPAEYWSSWKSYIFFRPEGKIALDGSTVFDTDFALHLGSDDALTTYDISRTIQIIDGQTTNVDITIDMQKFFNSVTLHDIENTPQIHSLVQLPIMKKLIENLKTAVK